MKHRTFLKLLIDLAMCIVYLMLTFADGVGGFFHEAVGIGIGALFIIHILLNRSMTKGLMASVRAGSGGISKRLLLASDLILFTGMPVVVLTGILIAKELFVLRIGLPWKLIFLLHKYVQFRNKLMEVSDETKEVCSCGSAAMRRLWRMCTDLSKGRDFRC